ncbi:MAG: TrkA C-terminal domain-containing protein [Desulfobulbaceae bacterium]|nr:TrkA C-terminal domain-containing protein [Desulfobulbaceae bacterium]
MLAVLSLFLVLILSLLISRIATIAMTYTGLSREAARFQARSALTGSGFTTAESEKVVTHPVRRRIILLLMLLGNAGIITAVSSLILAFVGKQEAAGLTARVIVLISGIALLWALSSSSLVDRYLSMVIERALKKYSRLEIKDYVNLLHLAGDYRITEMQVQEDDWIADKKLKDIRLWDEGVLVLGVERSEGAFLGAPKGNTLLKAGDNLVLYGHISVLDMIDDRQQGRKGEFEHLKAIREQKKRLQKESEIDPVE